MKHLTKIIIFMVAVFRLSSVSVWASDVASLRAQLASIDSQIASINAQLASLRSQLGEDEDDGGWRSGASGDEGEDGDGTSGGEGEDGERTPGDQAEDGDGTSGSEGEDGERISGDEGESDGDGPDTSEWEGQGDEPPADPDALEDWIRSRLAEEETGDDGELPEWAQGLDEREKSDFPDNYDEMTGGGVYTNRGVGDSQKVTDWNSDPMSGETNTRTRSESDYGNTGRNESDHTHETFPGGAWTDEGHTSGGAGMTDAEREIAGWNQSGNSAGGSATGATASEHYLESIRSEMRDNEFKTMRGVSDRVTDKIFIDTADVMGAEIDEVEDAVLIKKRFVDSAEVMIGEIEDVARTQKRFVDSADVLGATDEHEKIEELTEKFDEVTAR